MAPSIDNDPIARPLVQEEELAPSGDNILQTHTLTVTVVLYHHVNPSLSEIHWTLFLFSSRGKAAFQSCHEGFHYFDESNGCMTTEIARCQMSALVVSNFEGKLHCASHQVCIELHCIRTCDTLKDVHIRLS